MTGYTYHRNMSVMHASASIESVRQLHNDERRALWAAKYDARGFHRGNGKPRIRVRDGQVIRVTVPQPLCRPAQENTSTPVECAQAGSFQENQA
jgi:hypothetical protein